MIANDDLLTTARRRRRIGRSAWTRRELTAAERRAADRRRADLAAIDRLLAPNPWGTPMAM